MLAECGVHAHERLYYVPGRTEEVASARRDRLRPRLGVGSKNSETRGAGPLQPIGSIPCAAVGAIEITLTPTTLTIHHGRS